MSLDTIDVRDNTSGSSKSVRTTNNSDIHTPHHNIETMTLALSTDMVYGTVAITDTSTHSLITAPATSPDLNNRNYICAVQVANKGATAALITLKDGSPTSPDAGLAFIYAPAGATVSVVYPIPLKCSVGNAFEVAADASSTTIYVSAQGYVAP